MAYLGTAIETSMYGTVAETVQRFDDKIRENVGEDLPHWTTQSGQWSGGLADVDPQTSRKPLARLSDKTSRSN